MPKQNSPLTFRACRVAAMCGALIFAGNVSDAAPASGSAEPAREAAGSLALWQAALDQLSLGHKPEARVLLEQARARNGDAPEINMLLAWLAERNGQTVSPLLAPVAKQSRLANTWAAASPATVSPAATSPAMPVLGEMAGTSQNYPPAPAVQAPAVASQSDPKMAALEALMVNRVNEERRALGLRPLTTDSLLADTARAHSNEMRDKAYFAHESPTPALAEPLDRYRAAFDRTPALVAENIYRSWGGQRRPTEKEIEDAHAALMKSPGHRANIVQADETRIGIGFAVNAAGDLWVTQMFARG